MIINKAQSDFEIKNRNLNRMAEKLFAKGQMKEVKDFLNKTKFKYYNLRDKSQSAGTFKYKIPANEVLKNISSYDKFSVYESLAEADSKLILQGDIEITKNFLMRASLSDIKGISNRKAMENPIYNLYNYDLKERREPSIRGLKEVIDYVIVHELIGMVVEFSLFGIPVGINKKNIIIWELRNY